MDLSRAAYDRNLKIATMRALDTGATVGEIARKYQLAPKLLERWRGEWRAKGELAFPGNGHRGADLPAMEEGRRIAELERKVGQLTMENDVLKKALRALRARPGLPVAKGASGGMNKSGRSRKKEGKR
jgi:transposase-like protein